MKKLFSLFLLLRPIQWIKNGFVLAPLFFSFQFFHIGAWGNALLTVLAFITASSAAYAYNDIKDIAYDKKHPVKCHRPLAAGKLTIPMALWTTVSLIIATVALCLLLPGGVLPILLSYLILNFFYSHYLKYQPIIDVLVIATGFVLRVLAGGVAIHVPVSTWIITTTFLLALFIGFSKRYNELEHIGKRKKLRTSLQHYTVPLLQNFMAITCAATLVCYALYTVETAREKGKPALIYTGIFVCFGFFRYLNLLYTSKKMLDPDTLIFYDPPLLIAILLWFVTTLFFLM